MVNAISLLTLSRYTDIFAHLVSRPQRGVDIQYLSEPQRTVAVGDLKD